MPTYQYACTQCHEPLEVVQSFSDPALTECPACSGRLRKVFSAVGVVFKGSGFYKTDSRSGNGSSEKGSGDKVASPDKSADTAASSDKSSSDKRSSDKSSSDTSSRTPAPATASSSSSTPAAKSA